jgi:hypothetical protein
MDEGVLSVITRPNLLFAQKPHISVCNIFNQLNGNLRIKPTMNQSPPEEGPAV